MKFLLFIFLLLNLSLSAKNKDKNKNKETVPEKSANTKCVKIFCGKLTSLNGENLPGAKITINETGETFYTDLNGKYNITIHTDKNYSVSFQCIGFQPLNLSSQQMGVFATVSLTEL